MATLQEMYQKTVSSKEYDRMIRSVTPMCDYFNVNHFYYLRIQTNGDQAYWSWLGIHTGWMEYFIENIEVMAVWPMLRHPDKLISQVTLLKNTASPQFNNHLEMAWDKFKINFAVNIQKKNTWGIESYGFGVTSRNPKVDEHLLNELPLLKKFATYFCEENKKLINLAYDHQVEASSLLGPSFYEAPNTYPISPKREFFLKQLGLGALLSLTAREIDVLKFMAYGFPANYIAQKLYLSCRTVENYIAIIKSKLDCDSKVELIKKAQEMVSVMNLS